jgi:hypothetical protein
MGKDSWATIHGRGFAAKDSWAGFMDRFHGPVSWAVRRVGAPWRVPVEDVRPLADPAPFPLWRILGPAHRQGVIGINGIAQAGGADALPANEIRRLAPTRRKNFIYRINSLWADLP